MAGEYPDFAIGCAGGGTLRDFAGFAYPFIHQNLTNGKHAKVIAVEPASCPSMTRGKYAFDWGDQAATAPVVKMHTLGHTFIPPGIHAGGLRYHGTPALALRAQARCKCGTERQRAGGARRHTCTGTQVQVSCRWSGSDG